MKGVIDEIFPEYAGAADENGDSAFRCPTRGIGVGGGGVCERRGRGEGGAVFCVLEVVEWSINWKAKFGVHSL